MTKQLTDQAIASFDQRVKAAYEKGGMLKSTVTVKDNVVGSTHRFQRIGKGVATKRIAQTDVVPMNIVYGNTTATIEDWNAPEYTDIFDQQKVNFDEREQLARTIAMAIGRREDQLIIDALEAASTTLTVAKSIGGADTNLNTAKFRRARRLLNEQGVPTMKGERTAIVSSYGMEGLLGDSDADTFDKNAIKALVNGEINYWLGFDIIEIEDRTEGGLTVASNTRTNFFYHKASIGLATGINFRTEVNYIPQKTSWLCNGIFAAGSVYIDALGIVEVDTHEA